MKKIFTIIALLTWFNNNYAQSLTYSIQAEVKDSKGDLLFGNIIALSHTDSTLIKGNYFVDGKAMLSGIEQKEILLKITSIGYVDTLFVVNNAENAKSLDLGVIVLQERTLELGGVEIVGSIPLFEPSDNGGLMVNVQNTILESSTSVLEILTKSPNVIVSGSTVMVVGRGEAILYLNGKRITFEQLAAIPVQSVEKVEIISNPSAKYDAEGRAVINIILKPNPREGFEVGIVQNVIFAKHFLYAPALTVNYRKGKFSLSGNYSLTLGKDWNESEYRRGIQTGSGLYSSTNFGEENTRLTYVGNHSLGAAYQINSRHNVSIEYSGLYNIFDLDVQGNNTVISPSAVNNNLNIRNNGQTINLNNSLSFNYNGTIDSLGSTIFVGAQSSRFRNNLFDLIDERIYQNDVLINAAERNNVGFNNIALNTIQIDFSKKFKNSSRLDFGAKYGDVENQSKIDLYSRSEGSEFTLLPQFSNDFKYRELIPAIYAQWNGSLREKINYSIGARSEYSMITGFSATLNQMVLDTTYFNVFPNASLHYTHSEKWSYALAYTSRINRPKYQDLDPFLWYNDSLTSVQGNPFLIPELVNGGEASVQMKSYSLKMGYFHSLNPSRFMVFPGNAGDGSVVMQRANLQMKHSFVSTLSLPFKYKFYRSFNTISLTFDKYQDNRPEFVVGAISPQLYVYSYNQFKIKKWFNLEVIVDYEGSRNDGIFKDDHRYSLSVGLSKYLMNGDLTLRFLANDVLRTYRETGSATIGQITTNYDRRLNTNFYRFSVVYFFGRLKEVNYSNQNTGAGELDRIKK
jgi:hypothetical protein